PIGCGFKSNPEDQHVPKHFDLQFGEAHQKTAHERGYGTRGPKGSPETRGVKQGVDQRSSDSGEKIENGVNHPTPLILEDEAGKPQKPHVADEVEPTDMQEHRG